tara:strand:+ start:114 stop:596 length:483 start_codon:yes stop_codon:yes gene_type:complete
VLERRKLYKLSKKIGFKIIQKVVNMAVVRTNLHNVVAERKLDSPGGQISVKNNVSLKNVEEAGFNQGGKKGLRFSFTFDCDYQPNFGKITVDGHVFFVEEEKLINEIQESWDKDKRVPTTVMEQVLNAALHKGNIQAIKTAEDVGLPSPLPLPKVSKDKK